MTDKPRRSREDLNQTAFRIVQEATGQAPRTEPEPRVKDSGAVELGRRGGRKRAAKLSAEQLSEIGKKGAAARWDKSIESD